MGQWWSSGLNLKADKWQAVLQPRLSASGIFQVQAGSTDVGEAVLHVQNTAPVSATINTQNITGQ